MTAMKRARLANENDRRRRQNVHNVTVGEVCPICHGFRCRHISLLVPCAKLRCSAAAADMIPDVTAACCTAVLLLKYVA